MRQGLVRRHSLVGPLLLASVVKTIASFSLIEASSMEGMYRVSAKNNYALYPSRFFNICILIHCIHS
jgi:hypothetical protein